MIVIFETEFPQGRFEMVQAKTFVPKPNAVMEVVGDNEFVIVPIPEIKVQTPVPLAGAFAAMIALGAEIQTV